MDRIVVSVDELFETVSEIKRDGAEKVTISILEADEDENDRENDIPAALQLSAIGKYGSGITVNYDEIEAVLDD